MSPSGTADNLRRVVDAELVRPIGPVGDRLALMAVSAQGGPWGALAGNVSGVGIHPLSQVWPLCVRGRATYPHTMCKGLDLQRREIGFAFFQKCREGFSGMRRLEQAPKGSAFLGNLCEHLGQLAFFHEPLGFH